MFKVNFSSAVSEYFINRIKTDPNTNLPLNLDDASVNESVNSTIESMQNVIGNLSENPYFYPLLIDNVRIVIEVYLPVVLLYTIIDQEVFLIEHKTKMEVLQLD